ncbi:pilus assembly FimT family protein [Geoalkalibacter halelectricus]|uniref:Prepilin-type N-terminal cleavage/methylation domain-containing protein n=1 Tax=Geoalkalibacter halelectricus TaxID=2847045 RepID=A0ABY5ZHZ8_9BACT|nr:prepilin-type N-terminal cleavage/methylation domain-containing protein [Geoalkalibacter halelectricus]UWZ78519.1 prepilin-type N-terminal cleavage/methylation domain-containing protein [Geoalkalibacter halelectricus]
MPTLRAGICNKILRPATDARGFTLIELGIVVLILALMSVMTVPLLGRVGDADLKSAGRKLAGTVKYLYNEAALQGLTHRLTFDLDANDISSLRQETSGEWISLPGRRARAQLPGSVRISNVIVFGKGNFSSGTVSMDIYPVGWLEEAVLHLQDGSRKMTVRFSPLTGTAEFFDDHLEFH